MRNKFKVINDLQLSFSQVNRILDCYSSLNYLANNKIINSIKVINHKVIIKKGIYDISDLIFTLKEINKNDINNHLKNAVDSKKQLKMANTIWMKNYL